YEEAIPIDQEILPREQWKLKDFIESLKRNSDSPLKITFLANPYYFSMYFLDNFPHLQSLRKEAEELKRKGDNNGVKAVSPDKQ
ncbi:26289_t:CDS:1, partial [Racocetra persica]